jgi:hypothetical protein
MKTYNGVVIKNGKFICPRDSSHKVIVSFPASIEASYCLECSRKHFQESESCPHCGIKYGYAPGTGNCGCEEHL